MFGRRGVAVALGSLALVGSSLLWSPAASAGETGESQESITCTGQDSTTYSPGLSLLPQPTRIEAHAHYLCTGAPGEPVPARGRLVGLMNTSCVDVSGGHSGEIVTYADGRRSVISYSSAEATRLGAVTLVVLEGEVERGRGEGLPARRTVVLAHDALGTGCLSAEGIQHATGHPQLEIGSD